MDLKSWFRLLLIVIVYALLTDTRGPRVTRIQHFVLRIFVFIFSTLQEVEWSPVNRNFKQDKSVNIILFGRESVAGDSKNI